MEEINKPSSLEEGIRELDEIVRKMESADISLEESFELYKKGVIRLKDCTGMIDRIERQLTILEEGTEV